MDTEIGRIASMITDTEDEMTPLQKRLGDLGKLLSILSLGLCAGLFLLAVFQHRNIPEMLLVAISLAVAAVPEGLPAVVTICLKPVSDQNGQSAHHHSKTSFGGDTGSGQCGLFG